MTRVSFKESALYASRGLFNAISTERNIKIQIVIGAFIIFLGVLLGISKLYLITIIIVCFLVVILEMFNRGFEKLIDMISPEYNKEAGKIKDAMAGVVLATFTLAMIVSLLVLFEPVMRMLALLSKNSSSLVLITANILLVSIVLLTYYIKKAKQ
ncbi:MAG: diacylglycerol kinase family protein [Candidatus Pacearchaeota archaeon]|nr:diacylglycerol kinase family protein [Candidatus Pacearchaeota archaeon]